MVPCHSPRKLPVFPNPSIEPIFEAEQDRQAHNADGRTAAYCPEESLRSVGVGNAFEVHPEIGCEERQREEDDGDDGEDNDCFVIRFGDNSKFVLLDRAELKELSSGELPEVLRI